ncbi:glycoside hydrolase family 75 protein [Streptomyces sp. NPDC006475]|uniref:glycoside hydrolase family 75 protein n=1 Tax=Streptomyces sp. NPDC006475 TaxID=3155719 RepID=UPI0033A43D9C
MRTRTLALAVSGAALLAAVALPATASSAATGTGAFREGTVAAADLLAKVTGCPQISNGLYRTDSEAPATIPVCGKDGVVYWTADMDIDCDGQVTSACNTGTDPWFQAATTFHQSDGRALDAERLPYVVVPTSSAIWNYASAGIKGGGVVAVIHNNQVQYAVVGDTGPSQIIGEASYATARALGIDPDPSTGGTAAGVTYIFFPNTTVLPIENHEAAVTLGETLAKQFVAGFRQRGPAPEGTVRVR